MKRRHYLLVAVIAACFGFGGGFLAQRLAGKQARPAPAAAPSDVPMAGPLVADTGLGEQKPWSSVWPQTPAPEPHRPVVEPSPLDGSTAPTEPRPRWRARPDVEIKLATIIPEGTVLVDALRRMDAELRDRTGGRVGLKLFPGGVMGEENTVLRKVDFRQLQGGVFTGPGLGRIVPAIRVLEIPFFFRTYQEFDAAFEKVRRSLDSMLDEAGWVNLGRFEQGFAHFFFVWPVRTIAKLRNSTFAATNSDPLTTLLLDAVGSKWVPAAETDVLAFLATASVNAVLAPPGLASALHWDAKMRFVMDMPVANGVGSLLIRKDTFEEIPPQLRPVVLDITRRHGSQATQRARAESRRVLETMVSRGVRLDPPSETSTTDFVRVGEEVRRHLPGILYLDDPEKEETTRGLIEALVATVEASRQLEMTAAVP